MCPREAPRWFWTPTSILEGMLTPENLSEFVLCAAISHRSGHTHIDGPRRASTTRGPAMPMNLGRLLPATRRCIFTAASCKRPYSERGQFEASPVALRVGQPQWSPTVVADVVDQVVPAVVASPPRGACASREQFPFFPNDPFFRQFFGGGAPRAPEVRARSAPGSSCGPTVTS